MTHTTTHTKTQDSGSRLIHSPLPAVRDILLRPLELPSWNPAFLELAGPVRARAGDEYRLTGLKGLRGTFAYTTIDTDSPDFCRVDMAWSVPGMHERCSWQLRAEGENVLVTHDVGRSGPLAAILRSATAGLADLRLDRLAHVATADVTLR